MNIEVSDLVVGVMMTVLGLLGLVLTSGATDDGIYVFGMSLAGFALIFVLGIVRRHYDRQDERRAAQGRLGGARHV